MSAAAICESVTSTFTHPPSKAARIAGSFLIPPAMAIRLETFLRVAAEIPNNRSSWPEETGNPLLSK